MAKFAVVRKDLKEMELKVPIGDEESDDHVGPDGQWEYRWLEGDVFQIKVNGGWVNADSIDFDFSNGVL